MEEAQALREIVQTQKAQIEALTLRLSDEATCAAFLASPVGRTLVERMGSLTRLEEAVRATLGLSRSAPVSLDELREKLLARSG